jgi:hypothetical protein
MSLNEKMPVPQLSDLDPADEKAILRFRLQVALFRELGVKAYTDHSGRKVELFETGSRGFPSPVETSE